MEKFKLTKEILDDPENKGKVVATGYAENGVNGLFMTNTGGMLGWVVKVGQIGDWAMYCGWSHHSFEEITDNGDKVGSRWNIEHVIEIDDEVWKRYRR